MFDTLITLIVVAGLVEAVWETGKLFWENGKFSVNRVGVLVIALLLAYSFKLNIFALLGVEPVRNIPYLAEALTGLLISRGSNYVHDLVGKLKEGNLSE